MITKEQVLKVEAWIRAHKDDTMPGSNVKGANWEQLLHAMEAEGLSENDLETCINVLLDEGRVIETVFARFQIVERGTA